MRGAPLMHRLDDWFQTEAQGSDGVLYSGRYLGKDLSRDNPIPLHFPELLGQNLLCHTGESSS